MTRSLAILFCIGGVLAAPAALAQNPQPAPPEVTPAPVAPPNSPSPPPARIAPPGKDMPAGRHVMTDRLALQHGVLHPPPVDPGMHVTPPAGTRGTMPVIPPPGTPGGNQKVVPK